MSFFTVTKSNKGRDAIQTARYKIALSTVPGKELGPYTFTEARDQLSFAGLIALTDARDVVLDAFVKGSATTEGRDGG
jgi:hypothetical protein